MKYRLDKQGNKISQLGFGCMRFTKKGNSIDFDKAEKEVVEAINNGINYFDTAYIYSGSEECLGKILSKNELRDKVYIATKLPQYLMRSYQQIEKTFNEELNRLQTNYIDYYLMHMFTDLSEWEHLQSLGIEKWIAEHKANKTIKQIGFSYHGNSEMFLKLLDAYDWDFCQIQYNYLDENTQAGRIGLEAAQKKGIPVIIMEQLRGGKLVQLPEAANKLLKKHSANYTAAEFGLRWLWNQKAVTCILSGMNSMEMLEENIRIASQAQPGDFTEQEEQLAKEIVKIIKEKEKVGCTGCHYCMPCPKGVDIPANFYYYNLMYIEGAMPARMGYFQTVALRKNPSFATQCINCGKCESHCPQHLPIRELLKTADKKIRPWPVKFIIYLARKVMLKGK